MKDRPNAVQISTAHGVKGQEYPFVVVSNSHEKHFPLAYRERELKVPAILLRIIGKCPECKEELHSADELICSKCNCTIEEELHKEEERRLYYVALTRAKFELVITHSKKDMEDTENVRSKFIDDLMNKNDNEELIEHIPMCDDKDDGET